MRTAVILTGALRTIRKTMRYFKQNVLVHPDIHIFICVQNDTAESEDSWSQWFQQELGGQIRSINWFSLDKYPEWVKLRDLQLSHIQLPDVWANYLRSSGSMIEYFQLQLAYMKMSYAEQVSGCKYDYIIRARTDSIYAKPVDFHWLNWTEEEVAKRIEDVKEEMEQSKIETSLSAVLNYFMCTILSDDLIPNIQRIYAARYDCEGDILPHLSDKPFATALHQYITNGRYMLTLRKNNLYIVRRNLFYLIPSLGTMYGFHKSSDSDDYWFNAEGQFRDACKYSCITLYDYGTAFEETSLESSKWNHAKFFDPNFNCINPYMLYCVVRR